MAHVTRNPYEPPKANVVAADAESAVAPQPAELLVSANQLAVAAFVGGFAAAAWLAMTNYNAMGQPVEGRRMFLWSILALFVVMGIGFALPEQIPGVVFPIAYAFAVRALAEQKFGAMVKTHRDAGGLLVSWWRVVGIALLTAIIIFGIAFGVVMMLAMFGLMAV